MGRGELKFVEWLRGRCRSTEAHVRLGIGDDMAELRVGDSSILVTSDMLLDGVHFDSQQHGWNEIGRKALACSLSDCAAMAVRPLGAVISIALADSMSESDAKAIYEGMMTLAEGFSCPVVGGDTTSWNHRLAIDVCVLATPYEGLVPIRRSGAQAGDRIFVTGKLGGSILGRHLRFQPRVDEARRLAETWGRQLHAMMDISDGLSLDLYRLCEASHVGADLREGLLAQVEHDDARTLSLRDSKSAMEHVLSDGEDFELLLAVSPQCDPASVPVELFAVGEIVGDSAATLRLLHNDGRCERITPRGYEHFR